MLIAPTYLTDIATTWPFVEAVLTANASFVLTIPTVIELDTVRFLM